MMEGLTLLGQTPENSKMDGSRLPYLDWNSEEYKKDPATALRAVRDQSWIARTDRGYAILTYMDSRAIMDHDDFRRSINHISAEVNPYLANRTRMILRGMSGEHLRQNRAIVSRALRTKVVETLRSRIRGIFEELFEEAKLAQGCDLMEELIAPYPTRILSALLGVPMGDTETIDDWIATRMKWTDVLEAAHELDNIEEAWQNLEEYMLDLLAQKRRTPEDDVFSELILSNDEAGEAGMNDEEVVNNAIVLASAGRDTVRGQLALMVRAFLQHPDQWRQLISRSDLTRQAVEEGLRYAPVTGANAQEVLATTVYNGFEFQEDDAVDVMVMAANHDPDIYDDPDSFDISRTSRGHLTFGFGPHHCLGAMVARMELTEALDVMAERVESWRLVGDVGTKPSVLKGHVPVFLPVEATMR